MGTAPVFEVIQDEEFPGAWVVGAVDDGSEGEIYNAVFSGFNAEARAREYAAWKNAHAGTMAVGLNGQPVR